jgi:hypothetical protein
LEWTEGSGQKAGAGVVVVVLEEEEEEEELVVQRSSWRSRPAAWKMEDWLRGTFGCVD